MRTDLQFRRAKICSRMSTSAIDSYTVLRSSAALICLSSHMINGVNVSRIDTNSSCFARSGRILIDCGEVLETNMKMI